MEPRVRPQIARRLSNEGRDLLAQVMGGGQEPGLGAAPSPSGGSARLQRSISQPQRAAEPASPRTLRIGSGRRRGSAGDRERARSDDASQEAGGGGEQEGAQRERARVRRHLLARHSSRRARAAEGTRARGESGGSEREQGRRRALVRRRRGGWERGRGHVLRRR